MVNILKNRKGYLFALYMVMITIFMCGIVVFLYYQQNALTNNSLVSPEEVLKISDDYSLFELREKALISDSLEGLEIKEENLDNFKESFLDKITENQEIQNFIFNDLYFEGKSISGEVGGKETFIRGLYDFDFDGGFVVKRKNIGKNFLLSVDFQGRRNENVVFPVEVFFEFEREYLINDKDISYIAEVLE